MMGRGRGARPQSKAEQLGQNRPAVLSSSHRSSIDCPMSRHEKSLCEKRASLAGEPHSQDENVTEADKVRRSLSNPRPPKIMNFPHELPS